MATVDFKNFPDYKAGSVEGVVREATQWRNVRRDQILIDRARFERLRELAAALDDIGYIDWSEWPPQWDNEIDRLSRAREAIERGDLDPLPSPAHVSPSPSS